MKAIVTRQGIEEAIAVAVRKSSPQCEAFVAVYVETTRTRGPNNWSLKGIKYGKASRSECDLALERIIAVLQDGFDVAEEDAAEEARSIVPPVPIFD